MKKKVKVLHYIDTGIFPAIVMFSSGFEYDEVLKLLKKSKAKDWYSGLNDTRNKEIWGWLALRRDLENVKTGEKKTMFYIITPYFDFSDESYCKLAHEVLHICQFFLPDVLNRNKEYEAEAYLHTHIMRQCLRALRGE